MLTTKQAAQKWGISQKTIQKYCREGFIEGAMKLRQWQIPEQARPPLYRSPKKLGTHIQRTTAILQALDQQKTIPLSKLGPTLSEVSAHFQQLQNLGFVSANPLASENPDWFAQHQLTHKGSHYLHDKPQRQIDLELAMTINPVDHTIKLSAEAVFHPKDIK